MYKREASELHAAEHVAIYIYYKYTAKNIIITSSATRPLSEKKGLEVRAWLHAHHCDGRMNHDVHEHSMLIFIKKGGVEVWRCEGPPRTVCCVDRWLVCYTHVPAAQMGSRHKALLTHTHSEYLGGRKEIISTL